MGTRNGLRGLSGHSMVLVIDDGGMGGFIQTGEQHKTEVVRSLGRVAKIPYERTGFIRPGGFSFELLPFELLFVCTIVRLNYCSFELLT